MILVQRFIPLKEYSDSGLNLLTFIEKYFDICNFPEARPFVEHLLRTGLAIVLFDALNEVNQKRGLRGKIVRALSDFSKKYDKSQCLITCRIAATEYSFDYFTYVEIADFSAKQIRNFVKKWFLDKKRQDRFFSEFFHGENESLRELGRIPLLLSLLCLAFEERLTFTFLERQPGDGAPAVSSLDTVIHRLSFLKSYQRKSLVSHPQALSICT